MRISDWSSDLCSSDLELVSGDASEAGDDEDQSREGSDHLDRDTGIVDDLHSTLRLSKSLPAARRRRSSVRLTSTVMAPTNLPSWAMDMLSWAISAPVSSLISMSSTKMASGPTWKVFWNLASSPCQKSEVMALCPALRPLRRSEEHTSELQSLMRNSD